MSNQLRDRRKQRLYSQEELAEAVGVSPVSVRRWEAGQRPQPQHLRKLADVLEATPAQLGFEEPGPPLSGSGVDPDELPNLEEIQNAALRLRRSYSTTPPEEHTQRIEERLRQIRELLHRGHPAWQRDLLEAAAWLVLLRATTLADVRRYEPAQSAVHAARALAQDLATRTSRLGRGKPRLG